MALAAAFVLDLAPAAADRPVGTGIQVPLNGTVFVPLDNASADAVALSGMVHVLTYVLQPEGPRNRPDRVRISINLDRVSGVGSVSGLECAATGANRLNLPTPPTDPIRFSFDLRATMPPETPPGPIIPLDIAFILEFSVDTGQLTNVTIESMGVPVP